MNPLQASREFAGRVFQTVARAEKQRVKAELARKFRPAFAFCAVEGVLGLLTLCSAASRKSWPRYGMGVALFAVACGHAAIDIREQKILDFLSETLS